MRWKTITIRLAAILVVVLSGSVVLAQIGSGFDLSWHVIGGGGASGTLTGSGFSVSSTLGQLAIGPGGGTPFAVCSGYWCGVEPEKFWVWLPVVLRQYSPFLDAYEPNDTFDQAWGPLNSNQTYSAYFPTTSDNYDYYRFDMPATHSIEVWLTNIPSDTNYNLTLYNAAHALVDHSGNPGNADGYIHQDSLPAGTYYIRLNWQDGTSDTQPYDLRVVYQ